MISQEDKTLVEEALKQETNKPPAVVDEKVAGIFNPPAPTQPPAVVQEQPPHIVEQIHKEAVKHVVQNDQGVQEKVLKQAAVTVDNKLSEIDQRNIAERQQATYDANADACQNYGIDVAVPLWQIRLMKIGSGFWFVVYFLFATLTIAPVNVFFKGIRAFVKNNLVVLLLAILSYLLIVIGVPLVVNYFG